MKAACPLCGCSLVQRGHGIGTSESTTIWWSPSCIACGYRPWDATPDIHHRPTQEPASGRGEG